MGQVARHKAARAEAKRQAPVLVYRIHRREQALARARRTLERLEASLDARYAAMQQRAAVHNLCAGVHGPAHSELRH